MDLDRPYAGMLVVVADQPSFVAGTHIARREVLHGLSWLEHPVEVVSDDGNVLAVLVVDGAPFTFPDHPFGPHPWSGASAWQGASVLQLHRSGDWYSVWKSLT